MTYIVSVHYDCNGQLKAYGKRGGEVVFKRHGISPSGRAVRGVIVQELGTRVNGDETVRVKPSRDVPRDVRKLEGEIDLVV